MKAICTAALGILALLLSGCISGDEITSFVIESDGSVEFSIYKHNLTSSSEASETPEKQELARYITDLEDGSDDLFVKLAEANAQNVKVTVLRRAAPASVLVTGQIPSLPDFAVFLSEDAPFEEARFVCTALQEAQYSGIHTGAGG